MIYSENRKILVKTKDMIVVKFGNTRIPISKNDEIFVLEDLFPNEAEDGSTPTIIPMTFDEFYDNIDGDDFEEYSFTDDLSYIYGISVIHH